MGRTWISVPLGRTGICVGRSIADYEMRPRLPGWRRFEIREILMVWHTLGFDKPPPVVTEQEQLELDAKYCHEFMAKYHLTGTTAQCFVWHNAEISEREQRDKEDADEFRE